MKRMYYQTLRKRDFEFMEKGLIAGKNNELLVVGNVEFSSKLQRIIMKRPELVIGSDRFDYYEFMGRRREQLGM